MVAALDDGAFEPAERRILVLSNNAATPETANGIEDVAGVRGLVARFDAVFDYNASIAPQHPSAWRPRATDLPILERHFRALWALDDDVHLIVESIQVSPAVTLCRIFSDARIDVYADGLMSYGPTRNQLPALVASRVERLLHLDLVPGLTPVLLTEFGVPAQLISTDVFRTVIEDLGPPPTLISRASAGQVAVLVGQYLAAGGLLTMEEEADLHRQLVQGAVAAGFRSLVFKPHPTAPPLLAQPLFEEASRLGADLVVYDRPELVETWFRSEQVGCVVGCFSTALMTAANCYGVPAARVGTELLLDRLRPFQNSNRIPVTIIDAVLPHVTDLFLEGRGSSAAASPGQLGRIVRAVSYCMQPERYPGLRASAERLLDDQGEQVWRYFKRRRLTLLDLPGRLPPRTPRPSRLPRPVRLVVRRALGPSVSAQVSRISRRLSGPAADRSG